MNFVICAKCGLSVPRHRTIPIKMTIKNQTKTVLICEYHIEQVKKEQQENKHV